MTKEPFSAVKTFLIPLGILAAVVIFFLSYNIYLVDNSLEDLKFALNETAKAQTIAETGKLGVLLDDVLINEVSSLKLNSDNVTNLEFAKNLVSKGGMNTQLNDIDFLLNKLVKDKEKKRGAMLLAFDRMNEDLKRLSRFVTKQLPAGAVSPKAFKTADKIDTSLLSQAKDFEAKWQLKEAISAYEEFITKYPAYQQMRVVKIQLADAYFKSGNQREAKRLYEKLVAESPQSSEAKLAEVLLVKVNDRTKRQSEKEKINSVISKLLQSGPFTKDYNELDAVESQIEGFNNETQGLIANIAKDVDTAAKVVILEADLSMLDKARSFEEGWMLKEAQAAYEEFIAKYPQYKKLAAVKLLLCGVYLKSMQYDKLFSYYEGIIRDYPYSDEANLAKRLAAMTKDIISAHQRRQTLVENISKIKLTPELAQAYYNLGMMDIYLFDLKGAQAAFKKVIALAPNTDLARRAEFNLGWAYKFGGKFNEGITTFSRLTIKYPKDRLSLDSAYQIADSFYKSGRFREAAMNYENFTEKFADSPAAALAQLQTGYTYLYNLHDPLKASEAFKKLKAKYPQTDTTDYSSGRLMPSSERSYRDYGFILLKDGKILQAKEAFKKAITINREDAWAYSGLGIAETLLILFDEGITSAKEGVKKSPDGYTPAALGFTYDTKENYLQSIEEYKKAIEKNPDYAEAHYNLGRNYIMMGWYDLAIQEFKEAVRSNPMFAEAHINLGYAYWYKGRLVESEFEFKTAISYNKDLIESHYNLGLLYMITEKYEKAASAFRRVLSIMPDLEVARIQLEKAEKKIRR